MKTVKEKLSALRQLMQEHKLDFYYVPSGDEHKSEYVPACWQRRPWISGFTGSAGDVLVGKTAAYLWTDPRYFLQAEQELDSKLFTVMRQGQGEVAPIDQWLAQQGDDLRVGVDPKLMSLGQAIKIQNALEPTGGKLVALEENLIDQLWEDRPALSSSPVTLQAEKFSGLACDKKIAQLRADLKAQNCDAIVFTLLDTICWLFNIRGNDIAFNPLVISFAIITQKKAILFIDKKKLTKEIEAYLAKHELEAHPYEDFAKELNKLKGLVSCDPNSTSWWVAHQLKNADLHLQSSPVLLAKAIKNSTEQEGAREAHRIDAVAEIKFLHWLENHWQEGVTEISAADKLEEFRRQNPLCLDLSFTTISGFGPHGAIIHYSVNEKTNIRIDDSSLYLIDSGAQYHCGTTDITRTLHLGKPTAEQKKHYTLVLKGHLNLRHLHFPKGTCGEQINAIAHAPLWNENLDYGHGTGHGVGSYLCVHEGPQVIGGRYTNVPLMPGMIVSNEPGLYLEGKYGIRIENLCLIVEKASTKDSLSGHGPFYGMDDLTLVPYCRKLIDTDLLSKQEISWINEYHQLIYKTIADKLDADVKKWLKENTAPLS